MKVPMADVNARRRRDASRSLRLIKEAMRGLLTTSLNRKSTNVIRYATDGWPPPVIRERWPFSWQTKLWLGPRALVDVVVYRPLEIDGSMP